MAPLGIAWRFWGLDGPPKPPALGDAPAEPWRPSRMLCRAPAEPWRSSAFCVPEQGYSRMVSNWNLQPIGPSAFTALNPDIVS